LSNLFVKGSEGEQSLQRVLPGDGRLGHWRTGLRSVLARFRSGGEIELWLTEARRHEGH
jgi:hypothetical protein